MPTISQKLGEFFQGSFALSHSETSGEKSGGGGGPIDSNVNRNFRNSAFPNRRKIGLQNFPHTHNRYGRFPHHHLLDFSNDVI